MRYFLLFPSYRQSAFTLWCLPSKDLKLYLRLHLRVYLLLQCIPKWIDFTRFLLQFRLKKFKKTIVNFVHILASLPSESATFLIYDEIAWTCSSERILIPITRVLHPCSEYSVNLFSVLSINFYPVLACLSSITLSAPLTYNLNLEFSSTMMDILLRSLLNSKRWISLRFLWVPFWAMRMECSSSPRYSNPACFAASTNAHSSAEGP